MIGTESGRGKRVWRGILVTLLAFAAGVAVADARGVLFPSPMHESASTQPLHLVPRPVTMRATATGALTVQFQGGREITSPRGGTTTQVVVTTGSTVQPGSHVLSVDASPLFAYTAAYPLFRDLSPGDSGDDVAQLRAFLVSVGEVLPAQGARFDAGLARAVRSWRAKVGLPPSAGVPRSSLVWIGPAPVTVGEVVRSVGDPADGVIFRTARTPQAIAVAEGARLGWDGQDPAATLRVGSITAPYSAGSGLITEASAVDALAAHLATHPKDQATIESTAGTATLALPAGSILTDAEGDTCVLVAPSDTPLPVTVIGGAVGTVYLAPADGLADARVAAHPDGTKVVNGCG